MTLILSNLYRQVIEVKTSDYFCKMFYTVRHGPDICGLDLYCEVDKRNTLPVKGKILFYSRIKTKYLEKNSMRDLIYAIMKKMNQMLQMLIFHNENMKTFRKYEIILVNKIRFFMEKWKIKVSISEICI